MSFAENIHGMADRFYHHVEANPEREVTR